MVANRIMFSRNFGGNKTDLTTFVKAHNRLFIHIHFQLLDAMAVDNWNS